MKVLVIGYHNPHYQTITEYIERAVASLGNELHVFDVGRRIIPGRLRQRVPWLETLDRKWLNIRVTACAEKVRPDLFIVSGGDRIEASTVRHIRQAGIVTALWTTDAPAQFDPILRIAPLFERIFCQGTEAIEIFDRAGIRGACWLPMACDPAIHFPETLTERERVEYGHDVAFVGSYYPVREALFEGLAGLDFAIWGPGWERLRKDSPLRACVKGTHTKPAAWRKIYSASRIVLATHYRDPQRRFPVHQASPRVFEAMACGAFVITDRQRDVLELFRDGEHLVTAEGKASLREKVEYALSRPAERERIAAAGRQEALARHTYEQRLETLFDALRGIRTDPLPAREDHHGGPPELWKRGAGAA
jgi:spore maturation protein CgeB